jgi:hypothetical protein
MAKSLIGFRCSGSSGFGYYHVAHRRRAQPRLRTRINRTPLRNLSKCMPAPRIASDLGGWLAYMAALVTETDVLNASEGTTPDDHYCHLSALHPLDGATICKGSGLGRMQSESAGDEDLHGSVLCRSGVITSPMKSKKRIRNERKENNYARIRTGIENDSTD